VDYALWTGSRTEPPQISGRRIRLLGPEDLRPELAEIRIPTLVLKGPRDTYTPAAWARDIADRIPDARYVEIDETGHCSHISMPEDFNRKLVAWLDELDFEEEGA
jgi:pimeloyl-ACP methyl ester carboxylesterase